MAASCASGQRWASSHMCRALLGSPALLYSFSAASRRPSALHTSASLAAWSAAALGSCQAPFRQCWGLVVQVCVWGWDPAAERTRWVSGRSHGPREYGSSAGQLGDRCAGACCHALNTYSTGIVASKGVQRSCVSESRTATTRPYSVSSLDAGMGMCMMHETPEGHTTQAHAACLLLCPQSCLIPDLTIRSMAHAISWQCESQMMHAPADPEECLPGPHLQPAAQRQQLCPKPPPP